jgi:hypothetical protein
MPMMIFTNTVSRFLRDRSARLAMAPSRQGRERTRHRGGDWLDDEGRREAGLPPLLLAGLIAAVYVAARIGLSYLVL